MTEQPETPRFETVGETVLEGIALRRAGRITEAESLFQTVLGEQPRQADALHQLGLIRTAQADFVGAIQLLRAAVGAHPENATWLNDLANALCQDGDLVAAVAHYEKALAINPRLAECERRSGTAPIRR